MSLHPQRPEPVPTETARVARAAFPRGNPYLRMRDELGVLYADGDFAALFPARGKPAEAPWRLALVKRYGRRRDEARLPKGKAAQQDLAERVGADGADLLAALAAPDAPSAVRELPAVEVLRRVWVQNSDQGDGGIHWRSGDDLPPAAQFVSSPDDGDAHLGKQGGPCWVGDKVALTETCEDDLPNLVAHVETTPAPVADGEVTP